MGMLPKMLLETPSGICIEVFPGSSPMIVLWFFLEVQPGISPVNSSKVPTSV